MPPREWRVVQNNKQLKVQFSSVKLYKQPGGYKHSFVTSLQCPCAAFNCYYEVYALLTCTFCHVDTRNVTEASTNHRKESLSIVHNVLAC